MSEEDLNNDYRYGYDHGYDHGSKAEETKIIAYMEKLHGQYNPDEWKERTFLRNLIVAIKKGEHEKQ